MKKALWYVCTLLIIISTVTVFAQPFGGPPERGRGKLEHFKKLKLIEVLNLNENDAVRFFAKLNVHENKMQEIQKQRESLLDSLEILVKLKASEKSLEGVFDMLQDVEQQQLAERKTFRNDAKSVLSTEQVAKWLLFERKFMKEVRDRTGDMWRDRGERRREKEESK